MDIFSLISHIKKHKPIWDIHNKLHSNRKIVEMFWKEISVEMDVEENALRKKWKYLRDQFSVELGKVRTDSTDAGENSQSRKWIFFESLMFLKDSVKVRNTGSNTMSNTATDHEEMTSKHGDNTLDAVVEDSSSSEEFSSNESRYAAPPPLKSRKRKLNHSKEYERAIISMESEMMKHFKDRIAKNIIAEQKDDDELFFGSIMPHVRDIEPSKKLLFRNEVLKLLHKFVYENDLNP